MEREDILKENERRNSIAVQPYDPVTGEGCCGERAAVKGRRWMAAPEDGVTTGKKRTPLPIYMLPLSLISDPGFKKSRMKYVDWVRLRCRHDFEFWAAVCVRIKDKITGRDIPFRLNRPQRKVLEALERQRRAGVPIRIILLKARQWGGSTLIQIYMAWIQTVLTRNCHSLICAHSKDTASTIRGMYSKFLQNYPSDFWDGDDAPRLRPFENAASIKQIAGRGCNITIASSEKPDAIRGGDYALAHLSEVAFWRDTPQARPADFIRSICGGVNNGQGTLVVLESTANGVGNYFHKEWMRSINGEGDKEPVFVAWYEMEIYRKPRLRDPMRIYDSMDDYERTLWERHGCTLEQIAWYREKRREYIDAKSMYAEFPTTPGEAFVSTGLNVFSQNSVDRLREGCRKPDATGELQGDSVTGRDAIRNLHFIADEDGGLEVWKFPEGGNEESSRYVVAVDIGGRSADSDWSVIAVIDRHGAGGRPEVAAQWRGHADHDIVAWKAAAIARWYREALLVIESNTLETENCGGDPSLSVLTEIYDHYYNLYYRHDITSGTIRLGFHTNRSTKPMVITRLIAMARDGAYTEHDHKACDEMTVYRQSGTWYGAVDGNHDDILMTRAIGLSVAGEI